MDAGVAPQNQTMKTLSKSDNNSNNSKDESNNYEITLEDFNYPQQADQQQLPQTKTETTSTITTNNNVHIQSRLNTQTRRDLADLELVYRNLTTNDSDLNTLNKTMSANGNNLTTTGRAETIHQSNSSVLTGDESNLVGLQTIQAIRTGFFSFNN